MKVHPVKKGFLLGLLLNWLPEPASATPTPLALSTRDVGDVSHYTVNPGFPADGVDETTITRRENGDLVAGWRAHLASRGPAWKPIPDSGDDSKPGNGNGLLLPGSSIKPMSEYESIGEQQLSMHQKAVSSNKADTKIVENAGDLSKYPKNQAFMNVRKIAGYGFDDQTVLPRDVGTLKAFTRAMTGFDPQGAGFLGKVKTVKKGTQDNINTGEYGKKCKLLVFETAFKKKNDQITDHVPLNEMGVQYFIHAAGGKAKEFRAASFGNIQNKEFWEITRQNYNDKKEPFSKILTF